jgi:hypothetical protein
MKNFTKQNFKTTPLWVRLIIMAFMLLAGAGNVWARNYDGTEKLYFKMDAVSWWNCGTDGNQNFAYFFNESNNAWSGHAIKQENNIYYVVVPKGDWTKVILTRNWVTSGPSFDNKYNQTGNIPIDASKNYIESFSENSTSATWSTYTPPCTPATITWGTISATMSKGSTQIISTTLTSGAGSVTYTSSNTSVITVSGSKLTAVGNGTATITAKHSTVSSGYCTAEEINQSVTVSTKIPSGTKLYFDFSKAATWGSGHFLSIVASENTSYTANDSNTSGVGRGQYSPKKDNKPWVSLTEECTNIYSYTTTTDITTGISLWANDINDYNDVYNTDVVLNLKASDFDSQKLCFTVGSNSIHHNDQQTNCFWGSWGATIPVCCTTPAAPVITISNGEICEVNNATITITNTTDATYDENTEFKLYTTDHTGDTYKATTTKENPTFSVNLGKTYIVKAFNGTCKSGKSNDVTLTVYTQPTITQTKNTICKGEVINLNECVSKVPDNATLTWYSDEAHGAQLSGNALKVSPTKETTYYYQASIGGACTVDGSITLTVNELPENVDFGTNTTASVCQNASVNLTTLSAWTKDGQTIQWYSIDGDNYTPVDANQTITADCTFYAKAIFSNTGCESLGYTSFYIQTLESPDAPTLQPIIVCPQVGFDLTEKSGWTAPDDGSLNISWYEKSDEEYVAVNSAKLLNQGITQATTYYARVQNKETGCYSAYVSMSVSVATVLKLTITPATGTTTPWVPISYTVGTNETFEMSYPDGLTSLPNIEITQSNNGKTYTYKIPRPTDWGTGNKTPAREPKTYTIQAMLTGSSAECPSIGTATVTLNDEANDKCTSTK